MPDIFLSYSREDQATARLFAEGLEREGFSVWWDQSLTIGEAFDKITEKALDDAKAVVVLWSKNSVDSRWVRAEATQAQASGCLAPVMIETCKRPIMFELTHTVDLARWSGDRNDARWRSFVDGLRRFGSAGASGAPEPASTPTPTRSARPRVYWAAAIALVAVIAGALWIAEKRGENTPAVAPAAVAQTGPVTLAVLPFADLSQAKDQEYFSDGLTEEILNQLAQNRGLRVTGRTSSFSFKGKNEDLRKIAGQLGVANLLEGSIRKDGDNLRITAQLIDGKDGAHLWSKTYDRELKQVFTVQEEIARDVAQALSITLDVGATSRAAGGTTHVEAYDKYLQARGLSLQGGVASTLSTIRLLREAVALDPGFSRAWLALGTNLDTATLAASPADVDSMRKEAEIAYERGITLAPDTFAASTVRIDKLVEQHRWSEAGALFSKIMLTPDPRAQINLEAGGFFDYLMATGHMKEVVQNFQSVSQREPLSLFVSINLQAFLTATGQFEAAQAEYLRSQSLLGDHGRADYRAILRLLYQDAQPQVVREELRRQVAAKSTPLPLLAAVVGSIEDRNSAREIVRRTFETPSSQNQATLTVVYQLSDALGDRELALAALHKLVKDFNSVFSLWMAPQSGVRSDPRFKQLVRETGLADYYRETGDWGDFCKPLGADDFECK